MGTTTTVSSTLTGTTGQGDGDGTVSVAVQSELMMDYRMVSPFADASKTLAAAAFLTSQAGFFTITSSGGVAMVAADAGSDTGWAVTDMTFPVDNYGTVIDIAAYQDWYSATVVWVCTSTGVYYASSLYQWAWTPADLGQPAGTAIGGVRCLNRAYANQNQASVVAVEVEQTNYPVPQARLYCQPSGQPAYDNMITCPGAFLDWSAGPVMLPGTNTPQSGAFVCVPATQGDQPSPAGVWCMSNNAEDTPLSLAGSYPVLATAVNASGSLEAFVIDADDGNSLNYLSPSGFTFTKVPIAQTPGGNGQQVTSYPIASVTAVADGQGVIHVIACTTTGTVLHIASDEAGGWSVAAPVAELASAGELTAATDEDGDVHVFARADRTGAVTHLVLAGTGDWTTETISIDIPHQDYVQQIATYSATVSVLQPNGMPGCALPYTISATEPVTVQVDGTEADIDEDIFCPGVTSPDGQVVIVWETSSLSMPALYVWFQGMPQEDRVAIDMSGPIQATINAVTTGEELLGLQTASSNKTEYTSGNLLAGVNQADADNAADAIDAVMGLANQAEASADRLHPSSRPHAARYIAGWDGSRADRIDRTGRPDRYFRLNFTGDRPLHEPLDADGAAAARAELAGAGSWLPNVSWADVFSAVADTVGSITNVVVQAVGDVIDATITMVVAGVTYVWDAVVTGVGQLLDLVQTIFASLQAGFWALVGWLGWVFNWNDILLTHQAISYFLTTGIDWTKYALGSVQGTIDKAITGIQADLQNAVAAYLNSQVPAGSTLTSMIQAQPGPPAGTDVSGDPRNVFIRGLRANGQNATITASDVQPSPQVVTAANALLSQVQGYASAASGSAQLQAFTTLAEPTSTNTDGILDQPLAEVVQAVANGASWGLDLVQDGADTMFGLAAEAIDGFSTMFTQTWDIPLVTDIYAWVTDGSALTALDVISLLLAVPATLTYKVLFGQTPVPDQATLDAIVAAYPAPPTLGSSPADVGTSPDAATALEVGVRLGNILAGLSYIVCGFFEAQVDIGVALWRKPTGQIREEAKCPAEWRGAWWATEPNEIWDYLYVATEIMSQAFLWPVTFAPNMNNMDCGTVEGLANWMWTISNIQWILDGTALLFQKSVVQELWLAFGPGFLTLLGLAQVGVQVVNWFRLGSKGWAGSAAGLLTSLPNVGKILIAPVVQPDGIPIPALIEVGLDIYANLYGGYCYILNAVIAA